MKVIREEHQAIRALVASRQIRLTQLAVPLREAVVLFVATRSEITEMLATGELRGVPTNGPTCIPVWRLERLFARR